MFEDLLLHESTTASLVALAANPPQGLLLVGPEGIGKYTLAQALASRLVEHATNIRTIAPDEKNTIAIETIRELYKATRAKQEGRQVVIIDRADRMSIEAENAFLKLLEEPRPGLTFILTAPQPESLLPTILSRVQQVALPALSDEAIRRFIISKKPGIATSDLSQLTFLAQGRPGVALTLLEEDALPKQRERMQLAKQLITAKPYERFVLINKVATSREEALEMLDAMAHITEVQLASAAAAAQAAHWVNIAQAIEDTQQAIARNGNPKAQLLYLFSRY